MDPTRPVRIQPPGVLQHKFNRLRDNTELAEAQRWVGLEETGVRVLITTKHDLPVWELSEIKLLDEIDVKI